MKAVHSWKAKQQCIKEAKIGERCLPWQAGRAGGGGSCCQLRAALHTASLHRLLACVALE